MQRLEVSGVVRPIYGSLGVKRLIEHREVIAVCSEIHVKHINTPCERHVDFMNVKPGVT